MIEHLSGSHMNSFDNNIHEYYTRYVLWEIPQVFPQQAEAMEFGKQYELELWKKLGDKWSTQTECEMIIGGYKMFGLFDFYDWKTVVECKTRWTWWTTNEIRKSWQFRFYNYWCWENKKDFEIHCFQKKTGESNQWDIKWKDTYFVEEFIEKAQQIERFLKQFNIEVKHYDN